MSQPSSISKFFKNFDNNNVSTIYIYIYLAYLPQALTWERKSTTQKTRVKSINVLWKECRTRQETFNYVVCRIKFIIILSSFPFIYILHSHFIVIQTPRHMRKLKKNTRILQTHMFCHVIKIWYDTYYNWIISQGRRTKVSKNDDISVTCFPQCK